MILYRYYYVINFYPQQSGSTQYVTIYRNLPLKDLISLDCAHVLVLHGLEIDSFGHCAPPDGSCNTCRRLVRVPPGPHFLEQGVQLPHGETWHLVTVKKHIVNVSKAK